MPHYPGVKRRVTSSGTVKYDCYFHHPVTKKKKWLRGFSNAREAHEERRRAYDAACKVKYYTDKMTVADFAEKYIEEHARYTNRPRSLENVTRALRGPVNRIIGAIQLSKLDPGHIEKLQHQVAEEISQTRSATVSGHLRSMLKYAETHGYIMRNPARVVKKPKPAKKHHTVLEPDELKKLLDSCPDPRDRVIIALAGLAGLRRGEVFGLTWDNVDFKRNLIRVRKQLQNGREEPLKTEAARRDVPMIPMLRGLLVEWAAECGDLRYLFLNRFKKRMHAEDWCKTVFPRHLEAAAVPRITFHELRHTYGTIQAALGTPVVIIQKNMGHEDPSTTMRLYCHPTERQKAEWSKRFQEAFGSTVVAQEG